jgi:eukaryotic-like serine/threonine-protein kinase
MSDSPAKPPLTLEIAHVLFTDIVGYSKLPMDQQEQLLTELQNAVRATAEFVRAEAADELIRLPTGDGMALVFFRDAEAPVRCALELSRTLRKHPDLKLRMGIHSGPVYRVADINANRNVAGGGINIAQRVMDCGDAGHILVSREVAEVLGQLSGWRPMLYDLGEVEVKHSVRIHVYNLYTDGDGNPELPKKISAQREAQSLSVSGVKKKKPTVAILVVTIILVVASVCALLFYPRRAHALSETDTIVLADFANNTGDNVFDGTLRQGLAVQLEQSPFLRVVSEGQMRETLRLMGQPPDVRLTPEISRDLCQRVGSKAYLSASISSLGRQYVIGLNAENCETGDILVQEQVTAASKEKVLKALDGVVAKLRRRLGESLPTLQRLDTPLEQATTTSLEALQAYSLGVKASQGKGDFAASIPFFQRATELDPTFAMAYAMLGTNYYNLGDTAKALANTTKAFEFRDRVSEPEKFYISSNYYRDVTGDLEKASQAYHLWAETYPREPKAVGNLVKISHELGRYDEALSAAQSVLRLQPNALSYTNLMASYMFLNRFDEAKATAAEAQSHHFDSPSSYLNLYLIAFVEQDANSMAGAAAAVRKTSGHENIMLSYEALTAAYMGELVKASDLSRRAADSAQRAGDAEAAASRLANAALQETLMGHVVRGRRVVAAALAMSQDANDTAALVYALAGDTGRAEALANDLSKRFPEDTLVQNLPLPSIRALVALTHGNASKAIEILQTAVPYELSVSGQMYPVYIRGLAYLGAHNGLAAAAQFQKILDHRGIVPNTPIGALSHLGLARALVLQGDTAKARATYQDFLTLWKDADPDIPIFIAAKAEYAKLK